MKLVYRVMAFAGALAIIVSLLLTSVQAVAYWEPGFFEKEFEKYKVTEDLHMDMDETLRVADEMMDYLIGKRPDLVVYATVDGEENVSFFGEQEQFHMGEVKDLFVGGLYLRTWLLILAIFLIGTVIIMDDKGLRAVATEYLFAMLVFLVGLGGLAYYFSTDFTRGFTQFHEIFFDNDLWLFDPSQSLMINMLPEEFFTDCAIHIAVAFGVSMVVLGVIAVLIRNITKEKNEKE